MKSLLVIAALLAPSLANAEMLATRRTELRPQPAQKTTKSSERTLTRTSLRAPVAQAVTARGLGVEDVLGKLNGVYMTGLQRCYKKSLAMNPYLSGKLDLQFTVDATGRVSSDAQGNGDTGIAACVEGLMQRWHFGVALNDRAEPTDASFRISLILSAN